MSTLALIGFLCGLSLGAGIVIGYVLPREVAEKAWERGFTTAHHMGRGISRERAQHIPAPKHLSDVLPTWNPYSPTYERRDVDW